MGCGKLANVKAKCEKTAKWDGVSEMQLRILQEQQNLSREPAGFGEYA